MGSRGRNQALVAAVGCYSLCLAVVCLLVATNERSLTTVLGLAVGLAVAAAIFIDPYYGMALFIAAYYLRVGDRWPIFERMRLTFVAGLAAIVAWVVQYLITRRPPLVHHATIRALAGLCVAFIVSFIPRDLSAGVNLLLFGFSKSIIIALLLPNLVRSPRRLRSTCWLLFLLTAANALLVLRDPNFVGAGGEVRVEAVGTLGDPNDLAMVLVMCVPLLIALYRGERGFYTRLVLLLGGVSVFTCYFKCRSRGGYLGLAVVLVCEGWDRVRDPAKRRSFASVAIPVALVFVQIMFAGRGAGLRSVGQEDSAFDRKGAWRAGINMMLHYPLYGVGVGEFPSNTRRFAPPWWDLKRPMTAHNSFILIAGELGVPGLVFFCLMLRHAFGAATSARALAARAGAPFREAELTGAIRRVFVGWLVPAVFLSQSYEMWLYVSIGLCLAAETIWREELARQEQAQRAAETRDAEPSALVLQPSAVAGGDEESG